MKRTRFVAALPMLLLLLVAATHHPARQHADGAVPASVRSAGLQGTFVYTPQGSDNIEQAIRNGTARMSFITRPIARSRLKKTNLAYQLLKVEHTPTRVSITRDNLAPIVTPANGQTIRWKREDGELFDVNTVWEQGSLKQTFVAKDGSRTNLLTLSPDGTTLVMQVTIRSPRLPAPIVYKLDYKRKA